MYFLSYIPLYFSWYSKKGNVFSIGTGCVPGKVFLSTYNSQKNFLKIFKGIRLNCCFLVSCILKLSILLLQTISGLPVCPSDVCYFLFFSLGPENPFALFSTGSLRFPGSSGGKDSTCNAGVPVSIPGLGSSSPGKGMGYPLQYSWASTVAQMVKNLPAMWEAWVQSLVGEDPTC